MHLGMYVDTQVYLKMTLNTGVENNKVQFFEDSATGIKITINYFRLTTQVQNKK